MKIKVAFLDRDGVINSDKGYVHKINDFVVMPGVITACKEFINLGFEIIIVTNQAGIARGYYSQADMHKLHNHMKEIFLENDIRIKKIFFCPHHPEGTIKELSIECNCRKPKPGMFLKALNVFDIDLKSSLMVGDKFSDLIAAKEAGINKLYYVGNENIHHAPKKISNLKVKSGLLECLYDEKNRDL